MSQGKLLTSRIWLSVPRTSLYNWTFCISSYSCGPLLPAKGANA
jgi:hypothetical protein